MGETGRGAGGAGTVVQDAEADVFEDVTAFARVDGAELEAPLP